MTDPLFEEEYAALEADRAELCREHLHWYVAYKGSTRVALAPEFGAACSAALQRVGAVPCLIEEVLPERPMYVFTSLRLA
jgi:hypothetical protein